ncbi:hypothetical protein GQ597_02945 [Gilliamella sp. Pra-s65]|uniref:heavy-metal-associated domain-containing protein n=1 Tax=unclassified Gilliamella TaxID=2685620 RepID=UPI001365CEC5|nr:MULTISPECIES: heavy-metal-associated domain-containing protein [unclassified Gilliamella]MWN89668.1 hypothetical protein [Gilliamella sp. Pra-s65]MWP46209.1 hypothetical protein [Gilliamella sp. Pas-s27]MWP72676.1 hypothetical protein [Gilliamella sp. Pra-s52]
MKLIIDEMSCQHCVKAITKAINEIDPAVKVSVDLTKHEVDITNSTISQAAVIDAVSRAGYTSVKVVTS